MPRYRKPSMGLTQETVISRKTGNAMVKTRNCGFKRVLIPGKLRQKVKEAFKPDQSGALQPQLEDHYAVPTLEERLRILNRRKRAPNAKYPFEEMRVGQSFFVPEAFEASVRAAINRSIAIRGHDYFMGPWGGGYRVWRVR